MLRRILFALMLTAAPLAAVTQSASAHKVTCTHVDKLNGNIGCVGYHTHGGSEPDEPPPADRDPNEPYYEYRYLPMCSGNTIANNGDVMCMGAASYCEATGQEGTAFWVWRRLIMPTPRSEGPWERRDVACRGADEPGVPTTVQVAQYVQREFQQLVIARGTTRIDPGARSLINVETIFSTNKTEAEALPPLPLLGHQVVITVTPEEYRWQFGDGASLTTTVPGRPLEKDVTHVYKTAGSYEASVTISWSGTFTIDGGEPITIRGRATTMGPGTPIQILTAQTELVAK